VFDCPDVLPAFVCASGLDGIPQPPQTPGSITIHQLHYSTNSFPVLRTNLDEAIGPRHPDPPKLSLIGHLFSGRFSHVPMINTPRHNAVIHE
jgi:hypothetical protein